jgi:hypothetical protein
MEWKIDRATRSGVAWSAFDDAKKAARSRVVHSHSRRWRNRNCSGKVSVLRLVSIWNTLTPEAAMSWPMRQFDECSSDRC